MDNNSHESHCVLDKLININTDIIFYEMVILSVSLEPLKHILLKCNLYMTPTNQLQFDYLYYFAE